MGGRDVRVLPRKEADISEKTMFPYALAEAILSTVEQINWPSITGLDV